LKYKDKSKQQYFVFSVLLMYVIQLLFKENKSSSNLCEIFEYLKMKNSSNNTNIIFEPSFAPMPLKQKTNFKILSKIC